MKNKRIIRILCFSDIGNEINLLVILSSGAYATFIHIRTSNNYFENGTKNYFKNKGNAG